MNFSWNKKAQRYRVESVGDRRYQFIGVNELQTLVGDYITTKSQQAAALTDRLFSGDLSLLEWELELAKHLKESRLTAASVGSGGWKQMSNRDLGIVGQQMRREYAYLRNFSREIAKGTLSEAQIKARLKLYYSSIHGSYEATRGNQHKAAGFRWELWVTTATESCPDCLGFAARQWVPIGSNPQPGQKSRCRANCRCYKQYAISKPIGYEEAQSILQVQRGWLS